MKLENKATIKLSPQNIANIEMLNRALPTLTQPEKRDLMPNESAQEYYAHWESFRRTCEARSVLRWIAGAYFDNEYHPVADNCCRINHSVLCYFGKVTLGRQKEAVSNLRNDVLDLFDVVIEREPSLRDLLLSQLRLLK